MRKVRFLQKGADGKVFSFRDDDNNDKVVKVLSRISDSEGITNLFIFDLRSRLNYKYILNCNSICNRSRFERDRKFEKFAIISDFYRSDLRNYTPKNKDKILVCLLRAVSYLHHNDVIHGDIKEENILVSDDEDAVICDFGHSLIGGDENVKGIGTNGFRAPEVLKGIVRKESDLFSLATVIHNLYSDEVMFEGKDMEFIKENIKVEGKVGEIVLSMLNPDPEKRMSADQALNLLGETRDKYIKVNVKYFKPNLNEKLLKIARDFLDEHCDENILNLGIDIYARMDGRGMIGNRNKEYFLKTCIFIAHKYYMRYDSMSFYDIFEGKLPTKSTIIKNEEYILKTLGFIILGNKHNIESLLE